MNRGSTSQENQEEEPLIQVTEVAGIQAPERVDPIPQEEEVQTQAKLSPYDLWRADPNPSTLFAVTKSLKPTIDSILSGMQGAGNPHLAAKARVVAAKAVQSYDPSAGASLPTWVSQQLRQLARENRKSNNVVSIPEGVQLDAYTIYRKENEFMDEHDREPTVEELSDLTHLSISRIADVRKKMRPVANESSFDNEENSLLQGGSADFTKDATDYVYHDSDLIDRKILEYTLGYGGADTLDNKKIMEKLKISPVQLTRRKARLAMRIKDIVKDLEDVQ